MVKVDKTMSIDHMAKNVFKLSLEHVNLYWRENYTLGESLPNVRNGKVTAEIFLYQHTSNQNMLLKS
ncbi:WSSV127 [White spot syndrome virus]|uniref:WSSV127 n=1 Tax=White spot syndrome virus TaxID=342409 RepID=A0A2I6SBP2_9VIRU|nr:WSSV127 [White spot syndrome virus]